MLLYLVTLKVASDLAYSFHYFISYNMTHYPVAVDNALLAVGTYGDSFDSTSHGYTIVFDNAGKGQIFTATGNLLSTATNNIPTLTLGIPESVNMNEISLTDNAIPITMGTTAYILDKVPQGLCSPH